MIRFQEDLYDYKAQEGYLSYIFTPVMTLMAMAMVHYFPGETHKIQFI